MSASRIAVVKDGSSKARFSVSATSWAAADVMSPSSCARGVTAVPGAAAGRAPADGPAPCARDRPRSRIGVCMAVQILLPSFTGLPATLRCAGLPPSTGCRVELVAATSRSGCRRTSTASARASIPQRSRSPELTPTVGWWMRLEVSYVHGAAAWWSWSASQPTPAGFLSARAVRRLRRHVVAAARLPSGADGRPAWPMDGRGRRRRADATESRSLRIARCGPATARPSARTPPGHDADAMAAQRTTATGSWRGRQRRARPSPAAPGTGSAPTASHGWRAAPYDPLTAHLPHGRASEADLRNMPRELRGRSSRHMQG